MHFFSIFMAPLSRLKAIYEVIGKVLCFETHKCLLVHNFNFATQTFYPCLTLLNSLGMIATHCLWQRILKTLTTVIFLLFIENFWSQEDLRVLKQFFEVWISTLKLGYMTYLKKLVAKINTLDYFCIRLDFWINSS